MHTVHKKKPCLNINDHDIYDCTRAYFFAPKSTKKTIVAPKSTKNRLLVQIDKEIKNDVNITKESNDNDDKKLIKDCENNNIVSNKIICKYCDKYFTRTYSLKRHIGRCVIKNNIDNSIENELKYEINVLHLCTFKTPIFKIYYRYSFNFLVLFDCFFTYTTSLL